MKSKYFDYLQSEDFKLRRSQKRNLVYFVRCDDCTSSIYLQGSIYKVEIKSYGVCSSLSADFTCLSSARAFVDKLDSSFFSLPF